MSLAGSTRITGETEQSFDPSTEAGAKSASLDVGQATQARAEGVGIDEAGAHLDERGGQGIRSTLDDRARLVGCEFVGHA